MPFYEFSCPKCAVLLDYFSKRATSAVPACPHCGGPLDREVQAFFSGPRGVDTDAGDGLGGGFADPERAAAAGEGFEERLAAAAAHGGASAVAKEITTTAAAAGIAIDPDWKDAAAKAAAGDESAYDALVDAGVSPLSKDASPRTASRSGKPGDLPNPAGPQNPATTPNPAGPPKPATTPNPASPPNPTPPESPVRFRRDPVLREIPATPLPKRKPSPWTT